METGAQTSPSRAVLYLRIQTERPTDADLDRLSELRAYADRHGYNTVGTLVVTDPFDSEDTELPAAYRQSRQELREGAIDVIVQWHEDRGEPDTLTRDDFFWAVAHGH